MTYVLPLLFAQTVPPELLSNDANKILAFLVVVLAGVAVFLFYRLEKSQSGRLDDAKVHNAQLQNAVDVMDTLKDKLEPTRRR